MLLYIVTTNGQLKRANLIYIILRKGVPVSTIKIELRKLQRLANTCSEPDYDFSDFERRTEEIGACFQE